MRITNAKEGREAISIILHSDTLFMTPKCAFSSRECPLRSRKLCRVENNLKLRRDMVNGQEKYFLKPTLRETFEAEKPSAKQYSCLLIGLKSVEINGQALIHSLLNSHLKPPNSLFHLDNTSIRSLQLLAELGHCGMLLVNGLDFRGYG